MRRGLNDKLTQLYRTPLGLVPEAHLLNFQIAVQYYKNNVHRNHHPNSKRNPVLSFLYY